MKTSKQKRLAHFWPKESSLLELRPEKKAPADAVVWLFKNVVPDDTSVVFTDFTLHAERAGGDVIAWAPSAPILSRLGYAARCLVNAVDIDPDRRGGVPVIRGT